MLPATPQIQGRATPLAWIPNPAREPFFNTPAAQAVTFSTCDLFTVVVDAVAPSPGAGAVSVSLGVCALLDIVVTITAPPIGAGSVSVALSTCSLVLIVVDGGSFATGAGSVSVALSTCALAVVVVDAPAQSIPATQSVALTLCSLA